MTRKFGDHLQHVVSIVRRTLWRLPMSHLDYLVHRGQSAVGTIKWVDRNFDLGQRVCFFAHFDAQGRVRDYVIYYLEQLRDCGFSIVFCSTAPMLEAETRARLKGLCAAVIVRQNIDLDFGSWRCCMDLYPQVHEADCLLICNDSVYGPLTKIDPLFKRLDLLDPQPTIYGMTASREGRFHLQSYFLLFNRAAIRASFFKKFWAGVRHLHSKKSIIQLYELGLSRAASARGVALVPLFSPEASENQSGKTSVVPGSVSPPDLTYKNPTHHLWRQLVSEQKFPFVKRELVLRNPEKIELADFAELLINHTDYPPHLIKSANQDRLQAMGEARLQIDKKASVHASREPR